MQVRAKLGNLRIAPRKVRLVVDLIRKKKVEEARKILNFTVKRAAFPLLKLLNSAVANARNDFQLDPNNLYISKITVDEGRKYKRWRARARGQAYEIQKKTSYITLVLDQISEKKELKKVKKALPELAKKLEKDEKIEKAPKIEKPKFMPEVEKPKPKIVKGIKRIFRRKAF